MKEQIGLEKWEEDFLFLKVVAFVTSNYFKGTAAFLPVKLCRE